MSIDPNNADATLSDPRSWNAYVYVRNNPLAMVDPDGRDSLWVTNTATGQTTLQIPVKFTGSAATKKNVDTIVQRGSSLDTGGSGVRIEIIPTDTAINGVLNELDLSPGEDKQTYGERGEGIDDLGGTKGHIDSSKRMFTDAAVHDSLHFAGIEDRYIVDTDANGNQVVIPDPGFDDTNIMTSREGTKLKPSQLEEARGFRTTKQCTQETLDGGSTCN